MLTIPGGDRQDADGERDGARRDSAENGRDGLRRGDTLAGRYELERPTGKGGMGAVWVARDRVLDVAVAIKVIRRDARVSGAEARLLTEARAAARLGHPAVVRVLDFGKTDWGDPFMAMELLEGETLAALLAREKRLSPKRAVQILLPVIDGLAALHTKQIIHRDLKPDNIFLARDEASRLKPKIVDFGIAKLEERAPFAAITHCGEVLGSPAYMSPEQARGIGGIDHRTDIWSLCVVLYELIAGSRPFHAKNYHALLRDIIEGEPPRVPDPAACDDDLWTIIKAGLRKQKDERWGSMRELGEALALWLYERGVKEDICASCIRTAWLEAGLSGVKMELPPSARPIAGLWGKGVAPKIIDAEVMQAALAATEPQRAWSAASAPPADGLSEQDVIEQMRGLLCTGSTTETEARAAEADARAAEADARTAEGPEKLRALEVRKREEEADPVTDEREQHAYTKTARESKPPALNDREPKLLGSTAPRPRARRAAVAAITCLAAALLGAGVGLFGHRDAGVDERPAGSVGAAFAMEAATVAGTGGETKPAKVEAPLEKAAPETRAAAGSERDEAPADEKQASSEPPKKEAQRGDVKAQPKGTAPKPQATPKKGSAVFRKGTGDDFNFGF
jgi:serine/threonine-protein kinase